MVMRAALAFVHGVVVAAAVLAAASAPAWPQGAAIVLHQPISARAAAMGETGAADNSDPANVFFNPANVVGSTHVYVQGSRWGFESVFFDASDMWTGGGSVGISYARAGGSQPVTLSADLAYGRFDYGESTFWDPTGIPLGTYHSFEDYYALTLGAGFAFDNQWDLRLGGAVKRWAADLAPAEFTTSGVDAQFDAFAYDLGVTVARRAVVSDWGIVPAFAAAFVNAGPDIEVPDGSSDPLPTRFHFGTSVRVESPTARVFSADVPVIVVVYNVDGIERLHDGRFSWGIGGELAVAQMLFVRAGSFDFADNDRYLIDSGSGWGIGLGIPVSSFRARFDYTKTSLFYEKDKFGAALDWIF